MGKLYCCCAEASHVACLKCPKHYLIEPNEQVEVKEWPRKITQKIMKEARAKHLREMSTMFDN